MPIVGGVFTRTDGTRSGATVWSQAKAAGVLILSADHDTHDQDIATAINTCRFKDGSNTPTANLPMGGFRHTGISGATAANHYTSAAQARDSAFTYAADTGSANTYAIAPTIPITAYLSGQRFAFLAGATNTGASTLNVSGQGARTIEKLGQPLDPGDITTNDLVVVFYDGTQFQMVSPSRTPNIPAGSVGSTELATDAVITDKILAEAVTADKLLDGWIGTLTDVTMTATDLLVFGDVSDSNNQKRGSVQDIIDLVSPLSWVKFDGATGTIAAQSNVSSVVRNGTGDYTINWDTNYSSANYAVVVTAENSGSATIGTAIDQGSQAAGSVAVLCWRASNGNAVDGTNVFVMATGT